MTLGANLSLRLIAILLAGFVLLQLTILVFTAFPGTSADHGPADLPQPAALAAMAEAVERTPAHRRSALLAAFNDSIFTVRLADAFPVSEKNFSQDALLMQLYQAGLEGRTLRIGGREPIFGDGLGRRGFWPGRIFRPITLAIGLRSGNVLVVESRPSPVIRSVLNRRAFLGILGGLVILGALALAVRQTTRPLSRLSRNIRGFAGKLDAPALPVEGAREMRDLAQAYNEMRERIAGLVAERTRILAAVAHDMRTYLTRLRLRVEFIADENQRARAAADLGEMSALLDDTLLFAGGEESDTSLEAVDLAAELARIVAIRREMGEEVSLSPVSEVLTARANPLGLRRMLANLIDNGLRHGHKVEIAAAATSDGITVEVRDDGPGVPPDALARLGMPFQRLEPSRDRQTGGAGLGLAIVRALAARQGATVSFANRAPRGFIVSIVFPAARSVS